MTLTLTRAFSTIVSCIFILSQKHLKDPSYSLFHVSIIKLSLCLIYVLIHSLSETSKIAICRPFGITGLFILHCTWSKHSLYTYLYPPHHYFEPLSANIANNPFWTQYSDLVTNTHVIKVPHVCFSSRYTLSPLTNSYYDVFNLPLTS